MRDYKIVRPMELTHLVHTQRDERIWEKHASGMTVHRIARDEGCEDDVVRRIISSLWGKDTLYWERQRENAVREMYGV